MREKPCAPIMSDDSPEDIINELAFSKVGKRVCEFCEKSYSSKSGFLYHKCEKPKRYIAPPPEIKDDTPDDYIITVPKYVPISYDVLNLDKPDLEYIIEELIYEWIHTANIFAAIKTIYFNPNIRDNHSIIRKNKQHEKVYIYINNEWVVCSFAEGFKIMCRTAANFLTIYYYNHLLPKLKSINGLDFNNMEDRLTALNTSDDSVDVMSKITLMSNEDILILRRNVSEKLMYNRIDPRYLQN
jgi:hypothetical protein